MPSTKKNANQSAALLDPRESIDALDDRLVKLLAQRMQIAESIGDRKSSQEESSSPIRDTVREKEVYARWSDRAEAQGLSAYFSNRVLREILTWSRRVQEKSYGSDPSVEADPPRLSLGYQGEPGAHSESAARALFAGRPEELTRCQGYRSFEAVVEALDSDAIDRALLPIENSIAGSIADVNRLLWERDLCILAEEIHEVRHVLAALPQASLAEIREVRSHPAALDQCSAWIANQTRLKPTPWYDTAGAARSLVRKNSAKVAALCSEEAAIEHGLVVLARDVANHRENQTRFLLLGPSSETSDSRLPSKTSIALVLRHEQGALARVLATLSAHGLNLSRIESRPLPERPWEYGFLIDLDGHIEHVSVAEALDEIRAASSDLRVLGSYPRRDRGRDELPGSSCVSASASESIPTSNSEIQVESADLSRPQLQNESLPSKGKSPKRPQPAPSSKTPLAGPRKDGERSLVNVGSVPIGGERFVLISGPCAVESREQIQEAAAMVRRAGATILRGGAFKPRSSPYSFQGLGHEGVELLEEAGRDYELPVVTEILRSEDVALVAERADMLQVGARNMQNFELLKELGRTRKPILLKRGLSATINELLAAAEYIMAEGNQQVVLCERGIRTFETATRNTLDVSAVPVLKERSHLPVIVDPSHAAGQRHLVVPLALAAAAAGADGLIVEAHPNPEEALCDKDQALYAEDLDVMVNALRSIVVTQGKTL